MSLRKKYINRRFGGDEERFKREVLHRKDEAISWNDLETSIRAFPNYKEMALTLIRMRLGYLPDEHIVTKYLGFLQTHLAQSDQGIIDQTYFDQQATYYIQSIRNKDMKQGRWVAKKVFGQDDFERYENELGIYKLKARDRLISCLGYSPSLQHSLEAEIYLRQLIQHDSFHSYASSTEHDFKTATIVEYRKIFFNAV